MQITLNGESREIAPRVTLSELLKGLGLDPRLVAVELNREIVKRSELDGRRLGEGDVVEVVHFVGGG